LRGRRRFCPNQAEFEQHTYDISLHIHRIMPATLGFPLIDGLLFPLSSESAGACASHERSIRQFGDVNAFLEK
jgi:hypothetical protein